MPTYEFECQSCGHRHEVIMKMTEIGDYGKVCQQPSKGMHTNGPQPRPKCEGDLVQVYDNRGTQNFVLQGPGWTPKFGPVNSVDRRRYKP